MSQDILHKMGTLDKGASNSIPDHFFISHWFFFYHPNWTMSTMCNLKNCIKYTCAYTCHLLSLSKKCVCVVHGLLGGWINWWEHKAGLIYDGCI
jgi:hypothetical protein